MIHVRQARPEDNSTLTAIWLEASLLAQAFIPEDYWRKHQQAMEEQYLSQAEVYVAEEGVKLYGFVALVDHHLSAIFVSPEQQGKGIGSLLLQRAKTLRQVLELKVYQKNTKSLDFYRSHGFEIVAESIDSPPGEKEWVMQWKSE